MEDLESLQNIFFIYITAKLNNVSTLLTVPSLFQKCSFFCSAVGRYFEQKEYDYNESKALQQLLPQL